MKQALADRFLKGRLRTTYEISRAVADKWSADNVPRLSAAFSFYAMLSLAPFMVLATVFTVYSAGNDAAGRNSLMVYVKQTMGPEAGELLRSVVRNAQSQKATSFFASGVSFAVMFFGASNLFLQFDDAVRTIWGTKQTGSFVRLFIRARLTAFILVLVFGAGLIAWLYLDARLAYLTGSNADYRVARAVSFLSTFAVFILVCGFTMKKLATVNLKWKDVEAGALISALGLSIAKFLLGLYFAGSGIYNVYGPAGVIVIILLWIYYCSQIYFFGLEVVCVYAKMYGSLRTDEARP